MGNDYMKHPSSVKQLAGEIKRAADDYFSGKITNDRIEEVVRWYASSQADKLFSGDLLNPTVAKIIGKQRIQLLSDLLNL